MPASNSPPHLPPSTSSLLSEDATCAGFAAQPGPAGWRGFSRASPAPGMLRRRPSFGSELAPAPVATAAAGNRGRRSPLVF